MRTIYFILASLIFILHASTSTAVPLTDEAYRAQAEYNLELWTAAMMGETGYDVIETGVILVDGDELAIQTELRPGRYKVIGVSDDRCLDLDMIINKENGRGLASDELVDTCPICEFAIDDSMMITIKFVAYEYDSFANRTYVSYIVLHDSELTEEPSYVYINPSNYIWGDSQYFDKVRSSYLIGRIEMEDDWGMLLTYYSHELRKTPAFAEGYTIYFAPYIVQDQQNSSSSVFRLNIGCSGNSWIDMQNIMLRIDGEVFNLTFESFEVSKQILPDSMVYESIDLVGQEEIIRAIAGADEVVMVVIGGNTRINYRMSEIYLGLFREILDFYDNVFMLQNNYQGNNNVGNIQSEGIENSLIISLESRNNYWIELCRENDYEIQQTYTETISGSDEVNGWENELLLQTGYYHFFGAGDGNCIKNLDMVVYDENRNIVKSDTLNDNIPYLEIYVPWREVNYTVVIYGNDIECETGQFSLIVAIE